MTKSIIKGKTRALRHRRKHRVTPKPPKTISPKIERYSPFKKTLPRQYSNEKLIIRIGEQLDSKTRLYRNLESFAQDIRTYETRPHLRFHLTHQIRRKMTTTEELIENMGDDAKIQKIEYERLIRKLNPYGDFE